MIRALTIDAFPGSRASVISVPWYLRIAPQIINNADFPTSSTYMLTPALPIAGTPSLLRHAYCSNTHEPVQEYQPACHRLRLSASP
jgi:hypothetical protein